jgi:CDP-diacylglycerol---glycerol-3-phosphate 3-phosphatidyltransferase
VTPAPPARGVSAWNVANALTVLRVLLVPVFAWLLLRDGGQDDLWRMAAAGAFLLAVVTDRLDGEIARRYGLVTDFGKIADPIADKALTGMALVALSIMGDVWWWVTILVLAREWSITLLRLSVAKTVVIAAAASGKWKTTAQALALSLLTLPLRQLDGALDVPGDVVFYLGQASLAVAVALTLWSGYEFFRDFWRQRGHRRVSTP